MAQHLGADMSRMSDLQNLSNLLNPKANEADEEDDTIDNGPPGTAFTPAAIGPMKRNKYSKTLVKDPNDIWDEEEVPETTAYLEEDDGRAEPEYDISYQQKVTSEDMFLGMSGKNSSSACCEKIIVKIFLPDTKLADVDLDVKEKILDCRTSKYKLILALPHPVDPKSGKAQWNSQDFSLNVTLTMKREYDFINFH